MTFALERMTTVPHLQPQEIQRVHLQQKIKTFNPKTLLLLAGSGYGKTTLLAQLVRQARTKTVWLTLHPEDQDVYVFISTLHRALEQTGWVETAHWRPHELKQVSTQRLAQVFQQELQDLRRPLQVVLDQLEHLSPEGLTWLSQLVARSPETQRWMLAGIPSTEFDLGTLLGKQNTLMLGPEDLAFTKKETLAFLDKNNARTSLHWMKQIEGWPLGVVLQTRDSGGLEEWLKDHFQNLSPQVQHHLLGLSTCPLWTKESTHADGTPMPEGWLDEVLNSRLPVTRHADHAVPHQVLLDFLDRELKKDPPRFQHLHLQQGQQDIQQHQWLSALTHLQKASHTHMAFQFLDDLIEDLNARRQFRLVRKVLSEFDWETLPPSYRAQMYAACVETGDAPLAFSGTRELIEEGFIDPTVCWVMAIKCFREGNFIGTLEWSSKGRALGPPSKTIRFFMPEVLAFGRLDRSEEALLSARSYLEAAREQGSLYHTARSWVALANAYGDQGNLERAEQGYLTALEYLERYGEDRPKLEAYYNLSITYADLERNEDALKILKRGLAVEDGGSWQVLMLGVRGSVYAQMQEWDKAERDFLDALPLTEHYGWLDYTVNYLLALSDLYCMQGRPEHARVHLKRAEVLVEEGQEENNNAYHFSAGLYHLTDGQPDLALEHLLKVQKINLVAWSWALTPFLEAQCHQLLGALTFEHVQVAFQRLQPLGTLGPLVVAGQVLAGLLNACQQNGWYTHEIQQVLQKKPSGTKKDCHLTLFGAFQLSSGNSPLNLTSSRGKELLAYLALHGPTSREVLVDALWDGRRDEKHIQNFKFLVRQTRGQLQKALQVDFDPLPYQDGRYCLSPFLQLTCDLTEFLKPFPADTHLLQTQLALYTAEVCPELRSEWAQDLRQRCEEQHVQGILLLFRHLKGHAQEEALAVLYSALARTPLDVRLHEALKVEGQIMRAAEQP